MRNAVGNALPHALRTRSVNAPETRPDTRHQTPDTRHQTPEPITASRGRLVPTQCPALTTDRARELADMERFAALEPAAASRAGTRTQHPHPTPTTPTEEPA